MPIEDIDFLGLNSEVDSTLFFLDSGSRDRVAYPTPAEYVVQFSEPIKLVVGVDILDATIPAAMYVIDSNSNCMSVTLLTVNQGQGDGSALLSTLVATSELVASAMSSTTITALFCEVVDLVGSVPTTFGSPLLNCDFTRSSQFLVMVRQTSCVYAFASAPIVESALASPSVTKVLTLRKAVMYIQYGNYNVTSLMAQMSGTLKAVASMGLSLMDAKFGDFSVISPSSGTVELQGIYAFVNSSTAFVMDMDPLSSSAGFVMGFETLPIPSPGGYGYTCVTSMPQAFASVVSTSVPLTILSTAALVTPVNVVVAPGIANLLGVRYITLRCPEIEQHLYSGMTYGSHSTGLGVFKLPSGNEVSNLRFDFVSLVRKPFHPIGRLSRLTFRFERLEGVLYDFKGVNTQLLLAVKFLSPGKRIPLKRSVLNPDYDPDFLRYTMRGLCTSGLTDSDNASRPSGLLPVVAPYRDGDADADEGAGWGKGEGEGMVAGQADEDGEACADAGSIAEEHSRRRSIAQRLLSEQDKYDYPASENDTTSWRSV